MGTISVTLPADGETMDAADVNNPINTIVTAINGNLDSNNISAGGIIPSNLTTGTGSSWAWQSWTPTLTNITKGNGVEVAKYTQTGKTIDFYYSLTFGTTTSIAGASSKLTLPVTASSNPAQFSTIGNTSMFDTSAGASYYGPFILDSTTVGTFVAVKVDVTYAFGVDVSTSVPMTWATGDRLVVTGRYEAA